MYTLGKCPDFYFIYPWKHCPKRIDVINFCRTDYLIEFAEIDAQLQKHRRIKIPTSPKEPLPALVVCAILLQPSCADFIPPKYISLLGLDHATQVDYNQILDSYSKFVDHSRSRPYSLSFRSFGVAQTELQPLTPPGLSRKYFELTRPFSFAIPEASESNSTWT